MFGTYNGLTTTYDQAANEQQTATNIGLIAASAEERKARELTGVLLPNTVFHGQDFGGVIHFKREKRAKVLLLRVPVAGWVFEFPLEVPGK